MCCSERQAGAVDGSQAAPELVLQRLCLALGAVAALNGPEAVDAIASRGLLQVRASLILCCKCSCAELCCGSTSAGCALRAQGCNGPGAAPANDSSPDRRAWNFHAYSLILLHVAIRI